jgi:K+/H+ antiporter YhaU regulatory subunit KhtT
MRKVTVHERSIPSVGDLYELCAETGETVSVVFHRSGRRDIGIRPPDRDSTTVSVTLTHAEAIALAGVLAGVFVDVKIEDDAEPVPT